MSKLLKLATAQFSVSSSIKVNFKKISQQITTAASQGADILHFSECCLTGYPYIDIKNCTDDPELVISLEKVRQLANENNLWVIIGTHFFESDSTRPYNSLFVFNSEGEQVVRYDKRILAGAPGKSDQAHYAPGDDAATFIINGIKCGLIICHEWRYPEVFREYQQSDVELIFHSFYDGNLSVKEYESNGRELGELIMGSQRGNAANNYLWISSSNTSMAAQAFPSCLIRPDGSIHATATRNMEEILVTEIDLDEKYVDPSYYGRKRINELYPKDKQV